MSIIGPLYPEIWAKKWSKSGQIEVPERFFEKISRNMTRTKNALEHYCREFDCDQNSNGLGRYSVFYEGELFLSRISGTLSAGVMKFSINTRPLDKKKFFDEIFFLRNLF